MSRKQWVFDPNRGGVKLKAAVKQRLEARIGRYAEAHLAGRYRRLDIRFRGQFCYVDAYTEPEPPGPNCPRQIGRKAGKNIYNASVIRPSISFDCVTVVLKIAGV